MVRKSGLEKMPDGVQAQHADYSAEISKKEHEIAVLKSHIDDLQIRLNSSESTGALARKIFNRLDDRVMHFFNERGKKKQPVKRNHPQLIATGDESYQELIEISRVYDIKEFFAYTSRASSNNLRPHYRVTAKIYRTARDGALHAGSKLYRKTRRTD